MRCKIRARRHTIAKVELDRYCQCSVASVVATIVARAALSRSAFQWGTREIARRIERLLKQEVCVVFDSLQGDATLQQIVKGIGVLANARIGHGKRRLVRPDEKTLFRSIDFSLC